MRLQGKKALLTAAGQGIGRATAELFTKEGAEVIATDLDESLLASLQGCNTSRLDATDKSQIKAFAEQTGPVDILFNCAGYVHQGTILDCKDDDWHFSMNLNVSSMYYMCRAFLPMLIDNGGASIINMSSVASSIRGAPNRFAYGTTKAAVIGLTKSIAADFITQGIRCNAICPGTVQSPSLDDRMRELGDYETARKAFIARQPMGRLGTPDEIALLALYLGSDESAFTTGQTHIIDGGWAL